VLCEGEGRAGGEFSGKSREGVIVDFTLPAGFESPIGQFVNVKVDKALKWAVCGELII
jgi:tRNA-2-methylthio-N6-dimethylallyladenosine synthase